MAESTSQKLICVLSVATATSLPSGRNATAITVTGSRSCLNTSRLEIMVIIPQVFYDLRGDASFPLHVLLHTK